MVTLPRPQRYSVSRPAKLGFVTIREVERVVALRWVGIIRESPRSFAYVELARDNIGDEAGTVLS